MSENTESSIAEAMQWHKHIAWIHSSSKPWVPKPKELTEKGYYECITARKDIREKVTSWLSWMERNGKALLKDKERARRMREEGNGFFQNKDYRTAVERYTESAKYATSENNDFAIAIANRSAAFHRSHRYEKSLGDTRVALAAGYPKDKLWKLHLRAAECHLALGHERSAEEETDELRRAMDEDERFAPSIKKAILERIVQETRSASKMRREKADKPNATFEPEKLLPKNEKFRFASASLARRTSPTRGRYVIAERDVKKGEILFVEKPFAWVPVTHGNDASLCAHCCGCMEDSLLPCEGCLDALYCAPRCWREAQAYHCWECPGYRFALWQQIGVSHLAFKIFLLSVTSSDRAWFNDVHKLVTNVDKKSIDDILGIGIASLMLTLYMERCTKFFHLVDLNECHAEKFTDPSLSLTDVDLSTIEGKRLYVGAMIFRHSLQMLANAYAVTRIGESSTESGETLVIEEQQRVATGTYPSASELNHSCDPTVINTFWKNWLIVKALKNIPAGREIFNCYGPYFRRMSKSNRQTDLANQYCFHCECEICRDPSFDCYTERFNGLKCPQCFGSSRHLPSAKDTYRCYDCGADNELPSLCILEKAAEFSERGMNLADTGEWEAAIFYFDKALAIQDKYLYKHNEDIAITQDALGKCHASNASLIARCKEVSRFKFLKPSFDWPCTIVLYGISMIKNKGRWLASIGYLEKSLAAVEERYGSDSIEVANELNKLTDVCFQYLGRTPKRRTDEYRETFIKTRKYVDRALDIISLTSGPWNASYREVNDKKEQLTKMLEQLRL